MQDVTQQSALSRRQAEIANLVVAGKSSREIAETLSLSPRTVEHHLEAIFNKLGVGSRVELVTALLRPGSSERAHPAVPPLRSVVAIPNNLPRKLTSFIGREAEIAEITALLGLHQLVTLVGSGGVGKTRMSLAVVEGVFGAFPDGVWFVEFAPLSRGEYIPGTVAQALGLALAVDGDPVANLARALKSMQLLLVLDNCEHLVADVAKVVAGILNDCHTVKILASSREPLRVRGEAMYRVPSLGVPPELVAARAPAAEVRAYPAVALFVERATSFDNRFALTNENAPAVCDICRRLDGIPLAIELACARVKLLTPQQLRTRLAERFRVLGRGSRDVPPRHQTLRALIDWSYDLLDEHERLVFQRLGIFVNGFTLDGAAAVCRADELDEPEVFEVLSSLVDKSLALAEPDGDTLRYRFLESTRAIAREKLTEAGEDDLLAVRHLRYLTCRFLEADERYLRTARSAEIDALLAGELDDVRAALEFALNSGNALTGAQLLTASSQGWDSLGLDRELVVRSGAYLDSISESNACLAARLLTTVASMERYSSRSNSAIKAAKEAVIHARSCGELTPLADALIVYSLCAVSIGQFEAAEAALTEAESILPALEALRLRAERSRAFFNMYRGNLAEAASAYDLVLHADRTHGNSHAELRSILMLAEAEHWRGNTHRAIALVQDILPETGSRSYRNGSRIIRANLSGYLLAIDEITAGCEYSRGVISDLEHEADSPVAAIAFEHLSLGLALTSNIEIAAKLSAYADAVFRRNGFKRTFTEQKSHERLSNVFHERLASAECLRYKAEGEALSPEHAVALALQWSALAVGNGDEVTGR